MKKGKGGGGGGPDMNKKEFEIGYKQEFLKVDIH